MVHFNLIRKRPGPIEFRAYLYQVVNAGFYFSDYVIDKFMMEFPQVEDMERFDFNLIPNSRLSRFMNECLDLPLEVFYFENQVPADIADNDYKSFPHLFSRVREVSFELGGLIVLECFNYKISMLCDRRGNILKSYCHDICLGLNGMILLRHFGAFEGYWYLVHYNGEMIVSEEDENGKMLIYAPIGDPTDFPFLNRRDIIPEMFPEGEFPIPDNYPSANLTADEVVTELEKNRYNFAYLVDYYHDNTYLASKAVEINQSAFTFLSDRLIRDKAFIISLLQIAEANAGIYNYLDSELKMDLDIVRHCAETNPYIIKNLWPLNDKELIMLTSKQDVNLFHAASYALKRDRDLILDLVKIDWSVIKCLPIEMLLDVDFIHQIMAVYNHVDEQQVLSNKRNYRGAIDYIYPRNLTINELVKGVALEHPLIIKHIAPVHDMEIINACLDGYNDADWPPGFCGNPTQLEQDLTQLFGYVAQDLKDTKEFWMNARERNEYIAFIVPEKFR